MKFRSLALLTSVFIFFVTASSASTKYSGGSGEPNDPYKIATAQDLIDLGNEPNDYYKHFVQDANIDLSGYVFDGALIAWDTNSNKTGFFGNSFKGTFDGQGYIIKNLHIQGHDYLGMFGQIYSDAVLLNITLENTDVNGTGDYIGSLVGYNQGSIRLCCNDGVVSGNNTVGGLTGGNYGKIISSYNTGAIESKNNTAGGLAGSNYGNITLSYNTGAIESKNYTAGGLTGSNKNNGKIILSYNTGAIESKNNTAGGLAGSNYGNITLSYNTGAVESKNNTVGGLAGDNSGGCIISCYNSGVISGNWYVGGLAGSNYEGNIVRSYSIGQISKGTLYVGGLVGANCSPRTGCGFVTSSFWDIQASGRSSSDGGTGLTTAQMQDVNNYINAGWDFMGEQSNGTSNFWFIQENNYPQLTAFSEDAIYELQGSGTTNDPYLIYDANDLGTIWYRPAANYSLEADINLSDITWNQAVIPWLEGSFNGNNHLIQSLHIEGNNCLGLFGELYQNSEISNLTLESVDINGIGDYIGGLTGYNDYGIIISSKSSGSVSGNDYIGGLVGHNSGNISSCCSDSTVMGNRYIGGLVGNNGMSILTCYATGTIIGSSYVGGLIGQNNARFESKLSYSTGLVSGVNSIGGLVGNVNNYSFNTCFWDTETSGLSTSGGGIGKTTAEMYDINTYLNAGWDFIGETDNGTEDIWWIDNGLDYPKLWWEIETED